MSPLYEGSTFDISHVVVGPLETNAYLVMDRDTGASLIVDPGAEADTIIALAEGTDVQAVMSTHGHDDHHGAVPALTEALDVAFLLHYEDEAIAEKTPDWYLDEGALSIGETHGVILHTPGHTPGSLCLALDGVVLTGDTLFPGGPGATRFPYSSFTQIIDSIRSKLFALEDDVLVLPGHGPTTTIGSERPQLDTWIERGW